MISQEEIDTVKWDKLISDHYNSACKRNIEYSKKYTREEMKEWWYSVLKKTLLSEEEMIGWILGSTDANNRGIFYHPV